MGIVRSTLAVGIVIVAGTYVVSGCSGGSTTGGGGTGEGSCGPVESHVRSCGLLTTGRMNCSLIEELSSCEQSCLLNADCVALEASVCGSGSDTLDSCMDACDSEGGFRCADGTSIPADWVCDSEEDCDDGSDEAGCTLFPCADGSDSISPGWVCDGEEDCLDGSDEQNCGSSSQFQCADGSGAVSSDLVCDFDEDCPDGSDEAQGCADYACD